MPSPGITEVYIVGLADQRLLGNVSGGTAAAAQLTQAQVRTFLGLGTAAYEASSAFAAAVHTHTIADVAGLQIALDAKALQTITISAGTGLSGGGDLSANRSFALANTAVTPGSYTLASLTVDQQGRITAASSGAATSPGGSSGQMQYNNAGAFGGTVAIVYAGTGTHVVVTSQAAATIPLCVKGAASQSGNLTEWQNSSGTNLLRVSSSGSIQFGTQPDSISSANGQISIRSDNGVGNNATFTFGATGQLGLPGAVVMGGSVEVLSRSGTVVKVANNTGEVQIAPDGTSRLTVDLDATANNTRLLVWDVTAGSLRRVSIGAADSGGSGFRVLRIPN